MHLTNVGTEPFTVISAEITPPNPNLYISPSNCAIGSMLAVGQSCLFEVNVGTNNGEVGKINSKWCITASTATRTYRKCGRIIGKVVA